MSSMGINKDEEKRLNESRKRVKNAFYFALGSYTEQESKKLDDWREQSYYNLYMHLKHELEEVHRSKDLTKQIHNAMDCVGLSCILLASLMEKNGLFEKNDD